MERKREVVRCGETKRGQDQGVWGGGGGGGGAGPEGAREDEMSLGIRYEVLVVSY